MPLAIPRSQNKDMLLLLACAWNYVLLGAICGQYVADALITTWFTIIVTLLNFVIFRLLGCEFLWGVFMGRDVKASAKYAAVWIAFLLATIVIVGGTWSMWISFKSNYVLGIYSLPFPNFKDNETFQKVLYLIAYGLFSFVSVVLETVWWNVLYDNVAQNWWGMRIMATIAVFSSTFCLSTSSMLAKWNILYMTMTATTSALCMLLGFGLYKSWSLGAPFALRLGLAITQYLICFHVLNQWWTNNSMNWQYGWTANNLWGYGSN